MSKSASAWVDEDGSPVAFVFGSDGFSAVRSLEGDWRSPAPSVKLGEFMEDGYRSASGDEAETLLKAARISASVSPVLAK